MMLELRQVALDSEAGGLLLLLLWDNHGSVVRDAVRLKHIVYQASLPCQSFELLSFLQLGSGELY